MPLGVSTHYPPLEGRYKLYKKDHMVKKDEKDIKRLVVSMPKVEDRYSDDKNERDYIKKCSLGTHNHGTA